MKCRRHPVHALEVAVITKRSYHLHTSENVLSHRFAEMLSATQRIEPQQRAHSPPLAAGLAREYQNRLKIATVEDSLQLAAGFFNHKRMKSWKNKINRLCELPTKMPP
jgi:hypothetical protein